MCKIVHGRNAYYTLYVDGKFEGNYDTYQEAMREYEQETERRKCS